MRVYCILGDQRAYQAKSPALFSAVLQRMGLRATYVPFKVAPEDLGRAVDSLRALNIAGANVTAPYKEAVIPHLDRLSEGAAVIRAVNTIVRVGKDLKGYNTNAIGIMEALTASGFDPQGKAALVFGSGGAARAVVFILNWLRAGKIYVAARDPDAAHRLAARFGGRALRFEDLGLAPLPVNIVINASAVSSPDEAPEMAARIATLALCACERVFDLNFGLRQNFWQTLALAHGVPFMDGLTALAFQARRTVYLWTGLQPPASEFLNALKAVDRQR